MWLTLVDQSDVGCASLQFGSNVNFIFECDDLKYASPATVSRTAMLFLSEEAVDLGLIVKVGMRNRGL